MIDVCISQKYLGIAGSLHLDWVQETSSLSGTEPKGGGGAYVKVGVLTRVSTVLTWRLGAGVQCARNLLPLLVRRVAIVSEVLLEDNHVIGPEDEALAARRVHEVAVVDVERADEALGGRVTVRHQHGAHCRR